MKNIRALYRLLYFVFYTLWCIGQILLKSLASGLNASYSMKIRRQWARHLLPAIGVRMHVQGEAPDFPCILMGNHRSYLDPVVLIHDTFAYPVSKAEVAKWPIIGYGAKLTGILFLQRESQKSRKETLNGITQILREGHIVILFPEGTTHDKPLTIDLRAGGFKLAAADNFPIMPVAIEYRHKQDYWIGNDTFLPHFIKRFGEKHMDVYIRYGKPLQSADAQELMMQCKSWLDSALNDIHRELF